jgi:hypothetical protein
MSSRDLTELALVISFRRLQTVQSIRVACHALVVAPFVVACVTEMARGWVPSGDDAVIVFRSWLVISSHSPLVGQLTHVTSQHAVFDPGPMLFWFLTIPVHLDHLQGGLWGATLLCVAAVSLAVEAAWSAFRWPGAVGVVAVVLAMVAEFPALALDPTWNAHMGTVWFIATAAIAWAVAVGRLRWWPVLVVAASLASQSHLMFFVASTLCVVVAPIFGLVHHRKVRWWLPVGILAGLACWVAPLWQQFTSHPGNLSLLLDSEKGAGPSTGISFSLQSLAASVGPHPVWWGRGQVPSPDFFSLVIGVRAHPAWVGVAILVGLAVVLGLATLAKSRALAGLALIALLLSLGSVWTLASLPTSQFFSYFYIGPGLWPVGMIDLLVGAWSIGAVAFAAARIVRRGVTSRRDLRPGPLARGWAAAFLAATTLALIVAAGALVVHASADNQNPTEGWPAMHQVRLATERIEHAVPRGRLVVRAPSGFSTSYTVITGVDWLLYADGWRPESPPGFPTLIGPELGITKPAPPVTVVVTYNGGPTKIAITRGGR